MCHFGTFWHCLCHLEFLKYLTMNLTYKLGWQVNRLKYVSWLECRPHNGASIKLQETPTDKSIHVHRYFFSKRWEVSTWRETKNQREETRIDFIHSSKYLFHLPVHILSHLLVWRCFQLLPLPRFWASMLKLSLVDSFPAMGADGNEAKKGSEHVKAFTHKYSHANMLHLNNSHRQQHKFAWVHYTPICRFATWL